MRLLTVLTILVLAACNQSGGVPGKGTLVLSSQAHEVFERHTSNPRYRINAIAVDPGMRSMYTLGCLKGMEPECLRTGENTAVERCNKNGRFDCKLLYAHGKFVWEGALLLHHKSAGQSLPFHGQWTISVDPDQGEKRTFKLVSSLGKSRVLGFGGHPSCDVRFDPGTNSQGGQVHIQCPGGEDYRIRYNRASSGHLASITDVPGLGRSVVDLKLNEGVPLPPSQQF